MGNEEKRWKEKRLGNGKEKERRQGQNILKNYRVPMKIVNTKYGIVNLKNCEENVICWQKCTLLTKMKLYILRKKNFSHWIKNHSQIFFMILSLTHNIWGTYKSKVELWKLYRAKQNSTNSEK